MVCPPGSVLYFIGTTWHGAGANRSNKARRSLTVQYCQPYIRPIENQILAVDPRRLEQIDKNIVDMMGYMIHRPFIGYGPSASHISTSNHHLRSPDHTCIPHLLPFLDHHVITNLDHLSLYSLYINSVSERIRRRGQAAVHHI